MRAPYITIKNFLSREDAAVLTSYIRDNIRTHSEVNGNHLFDYVTIRPKAIEPGDARRIMIDAALDIRSLHRTYFKNRAIELESVTLNEWPIGMELALHSDNTYYPSMEPNYVAWRTHSAVVYLNQEYSGGEFEWLNGDVIRPETGMAILFGSGPEYVHGVRKVMSGIRYTMPMWFTEDVSKIIPDCLTPEFKRDTL